MGSGRWDADTHASTYSASVAAGTSMGYSRTTTTSTPRSSWSAHDLLDPLAVAGPDSPFAGKNVREARDNDEHPNSTPLVIAFDNTGSMGENPYLLQKKLPELFGLLLRKGYIEDPQIAMSCYGDAHVDPVALQFSAFESDNRIDDCLDNMLIVHGGGGNDGETATLVWYYAAKHTAHDAWDKRGKRGYLITIGDEKPLHITRQQIKDLMGDDVQDDVTPEQAVALAKEQWDCYHIIVQTGAEVWQKSRDVYGALLGKDHVLELQDPDAICETIAGLIGVLEGTVDHDELVEDLKAIGADDKAVEDTTRALATVAANGGRKLGEVVTADTPADLTDDEDDALETV